MKKIVYGFALMFAASLIGAEANAPTTAKGGTEATKPASPLIETLKNRKEISTFVKALIASQADLVLVKGDNYTFLIPTDEAFQKLSPQVLDDLLKPENRDKLKALILMHVIPKKVLAKEIKSGAQKNLAGKNLDFFIRGAAITVDGANVIQMDQPLPNGVFHEIDMVIMPDSNAKPATDQVNKK